jgi:hypothetical protein
MSAGFVQMPLAEYDKLRERERTITALKNHMNEASEHLSIFITDIAKDENVQRAMAEFNASQGAARFRAEGGRVRLQLLNQSSNE